MITADHVEVARHRHAEHLRTADHHAREDGPTHRAESPSGARRQLAGALRRAADRLEPQHLRTRPGLSIVR